MNEERQVVVAIPVRDEQEHIGRCLESLRGQTMKADAVLLFLNNCLDATASATREFTNSIGLIVIEEVLTGDAACAGEARRRALAHAEARFPDAVILTTDADGRPEGDWIERNLRALEKGADVVCGRAELFAEDRANIREALHADNRREMTLLGLLDEIEARVSPDPADPWPRHTSDSGASIAMRPGVLRRICGAPAVTFGEDRALIQRCRMIDLKIRHDVEILVEVSGRLEGRAAGGMSETIKRRNRQQDELTDVQLEPAADRHRRSLAKARLRACWEHPAPLAGIAADLRLEEPLLEALLQAPFFGAAWDAVQALSPVLPRLRVAYAQLPDEIARAREILAGLTAPGMPLAAEAGAAILSSLTG